MRQFGYLLALVVIGAFLTVPSFADDNGAKLEALYRAVKAYNSQNASMITAINGETIGMLIKSGFLSGSAADYAGFRSEGDLTGNGAIVPPAAVTPTKAPPTVEGKLGALYEAIKRYNSDHTSMLTKVDYDTLKILVSQGYLPGEVGDYEGFRSEGDLTANGKIVPPRPPVDGPAPASVDGKLDALYRAIKLFNSDHASMLTAINAETIALLIKDRYLPGTEADYKGFQSEGDLTGNGRILPPSGTTVATSTAPVSVDQKLVALYDAVKRYNLQHPAMITTINADTIAVLVREGFLPGTAADYKGYRSEGDLTGDGKILPPSDQPPVVGPASATVQPPVVKPPRPPRPPRNPFDRFIRMILEALRRIFGINIPLPPPPPLPPAPPPATWTADPATGTVDPATWTVDPATGTRDLPGQEGTTIQEPDGDQPQEKSNSSADSDLNE